MRHDGNTGVLDDVTEGSATHRAQTPLTDRNYLAADRLRRSMTTRRLRPAPSRLVQVSKGNLRTNSKLSRLLSTSLETGPPIGVEKGPSLARFNSGDLLEAFSSPPWAGGRRRRFIQVC